MTSRPLASQHSSSGAEGALKQAAPAPTCSERPLVISSMPSSLLHVRRGLYEAVLLAEQHGAVVVERDLPLEDMVLSANTAACLWTEARLEQVRSGGQG